MDDAAWFRDLVEELGRAKKLRAELLADGPTVFHAHIGTRNGKPLYEVRVDLARDYASFRTTDVPYGEVEQVFKAGMAEQFSPFDDITKAHPTSLDLRTWLVQHCRRA